MSLFRSPKWKLCRRKRNCVRSEGSELFESKFMFVVFKISVLNTYSFVLVLGGWRGVGGAFVEAVIIGGEQSRSQGRFGLKNEETECIRLPVSCRLLSVCVVVMVKATTATVKFIYGCACEPKSWNDTNFVAKQHLDADRKWWVARLRTLDHSDEPSSTRRKNIACPLSIVPKHRLFTTICIKYIIKFTNALREELMVVDHCYHQPPESHYFSWIGDDDDGDEQWASGSGGEKSFFISVCHNPTTDDEI